MLPTEFLNALVCPCRPSAALYLRRAGAPDPVVRAAGGAEVADRHLPRHQDPRDQRGLDLYRPLARRHVGARGLHYERQLSSTVNDIDHIESQSLPGYGIVKIFFQPNVDIRTATAQVTSISQTVLKQMPPGITPPLILNYNASTVPILQLALSSTQESEQKLFDYGQNFIRPQLATVPGTVANCGRMKFCP